MQQRPRPCRRHRRRRRPCLPGYLSGRVGRADLRRCDAAAGHLSELDWRLICSSRTLVSTELRSGSLEIVYGMGDPLKTYGEMRQAWERRRRMGGRQAIWGAKIALKPGIWERWRPADFACFYEFLARGGGPAFATVKASRGACCECRGV